MLSTWRETQPKSKGHSQSQLRGRCQALRAALTSPPSEPRSRPEKTRGPGEPTQRPSVQGVSRLCRKSFRKSHLGTCVTLTCSHSPGPGEPRSPASSGSVPRDRGALPRRAAPPSLRLAFPRRGPAIARGSRRGSCEDRPTGAGGLRARARQDARRRDCGRTRAQPGRGRRSAARMLQCGASAPPTGARGRFLPRRRLPARGEETHLFRALLRPGAAFPFPRSVLGP